MLEQKGFEDIGMKIQQPKNSAPSNMQITAEQIIKESLAHRTDELKIPVQRINDEEELSEYKLTKRKEFEEQLKKQRYNVSIWLRYAEWEEHQTEFMRARSIFERALEVDYKNVSLWIKYAEMEMKNKFINHARNIWERACKYLPMNDKLWYKWAYMEELIGNYIGAREIFNTWMTWKPNIIGWKTYIKFEERMGEFKKARIVLYKYLNTMHTKESFLFAAKKEEKNKNYLSARNIYERGIKELDFDILDQDYFLAFINFELFHKEFERCRTLFKFCLENLKGNKEKIYEQYIIFEKKYGTIESLEDILINNKRMYYQNEIKSNPLNYDIWFNYTKLEEEFGNESSCRELYEKAISNVPIINEKIYWKRYIYLWINYALYEECICKNYSLAEEIYTKLINLIPHKKFTFNKVWILITNFFIRRKNIERVRKTFGMNMGMCPKEKIIDSYINFEMQLGNIDRIKTIFQRYIQLFPNKFSVWNKYAEFEINCNEIQIAEILYINALKFLKSSKNNFKDIFECYKKMIELYVNQDLLDKNIQIKLLEAYDNLLNDEIIKEHLKYKELCDIYENYIDYLCVFKKMNKVDEIYKELLISVDRNNIDEFTKICDLWKNRYVNNDKKVKQINEYISNYNLKSKLKESEIKTKNEENAENNKKKISILDKAFNWKKGNSDLNIKKEN